MTGFWGREYEGSWGWGVRCMYKSSRRLLVDLLYESGIKHAVDRILEEPIRRLAMRWLRKNGFWIFALVLVVLVAFLVHRARLP